MWHRNIDLNLNWFFIKFWNLFQINTLLQAHTSYMITVDLLEHLNAHYIQMILLLHVWQKVNNTILRKFFWLRHEHSCILSDFTKWFYAHLFEASVNFQDRQGRWWWHYHLIDENLFKFSDINCINELHSLIVVKLRFKMDFFKSIYSFIWESGRERERQKDPLLFLSSNACE